MKINQARRWGSPPPLAYMTGIEKLHVAKGSEADRGVPVMQGTNNRLCSEEHSLLIVTSGQGSFKLEEDVLHRAFPGQCLLLPASTPVEAEADAGRTLALYRVTYRLERDDLSQLAKAAAVSCEPAAALDRLLAEMLTVGTDEREKERMGDHLRFLGILYELLKRKQAAAYADLTGVERSVRQLQLHYRADISFSEMAEEAGVSRWQFGEQFKQLTGLSPVAYLTKLRIQHAKQLMADSGLTVKEIASLSGFRDEYYFSRRFKQTTGMTPTQYRHGRQPRIFSIQYVGELLALGIEPIGTNRAMLDVFKDWSGAAIEEPIDMEQLSALKPDLIICPTFTPKRLVEPLQQIAPTVSFDWQADVYSRLRAIGERLGRSKEADEWIARYEAKAVRVRSRLKPYIQPGMTASAFVYHAHGLYVYAGHHFGHTLYHALGFDAPNGVKRLIESDSQMKWKKISVEHLEEYAGDVVFFALASSGADALEGRSLLEHPAWRSLHAVQQGRGYVVDAVWGNYNPVTLERHLDEMASRLGQNI